MITTDQLAQALEQQLQGSPIFVVSAEVRPGGKAIVEVDNDKHDPSRPSGISLAELTEINRGLRDTFGPALDDVELEVGSPGLGRPFRVARQYQQHVGRKVQVTLRDGSQLEGRLETVDEKGITLCVQHPSTVKGRLPKLDKEATAIPFTGISETRTLITFNQTFVP